MKLTILSYNTLFGGRDGASDERSTLQIELINSIRPDVFLMQEAKGFDANGSALLHALEAKTGMRGFLAIAPRTGQNTAVFIRSPLTPISFEQDGSNFHHVTATLTVALPGGGRQIKFTSAHLCPNGPEIRRREAAHLAVQAVPTALALLAGDFNSASPHDPEPEGLQDLPAHHRARYIGSDPLKADRSVLAYLENAGWTDIGHRLGNADPTVPTASFENTEFAVMRCDYVMATSSLSAYASAYRVIRSSETGRASDHYPVLAEFDLPS